MNKWLWVALIVLAVAFLVLAVSGGTVNPDPHWPPWQIDW